MSEYVCELIDPKYEMEWAPKEEIVRCRDCKYLEMITVSYSDKPLFACTAEWCIGAEGDNPLVEPDGFCKWRVRRDA